MDLRQGQHGGLVVHQVVCQEARHRSATGRLCLQTVDEEGANVIPTYEKIETIVNSFLTEYRAEGAMGSLVEVHSGVYRVVADGKIVMVSRSAAGWRVQFKAAVGQDRELITAARTALEAGSKMEVSKHTDLARDLEIPSDE
jgi:hypothetical protein